IIQAGEDVLPIVAGLSPAQLWARPGGAAAIGFHLAHLPGSLDRLLTYARGDTLSDVQLAAHAAERALHDDRPELAGLCSRFAAGIAAALAYLQTVAGASLLEPREVGKLRLPSNTLGLIFHAAEHSSRHVGQVVTLVKVVRAPS
ncbi:MAG: DinB family protein, partial [Gemmatimonadales bacterium]